jgi:Mn2+/Fe2+ NRAMP family transporter
MSEKPLDLYRLLPENIEDPPTTFVAILRRIGPGLILASSIVGSGELIATTVLGAENGYTLLWLILLSCVIKIVVQNELGRYSIGSGETTLEAFDRAPGPRLRVSWLVWMWFFMVTMTLMQVGGMMGAISEILNRTVPTVPITAWVWVINALSVVLLIGGRYVIVERVSMALVVSFTALTVSCAVLLFKLPQYFSWSNMLDGLTFQPPAGGLVTAVAAFGITGVGATELVMYPYWCIEKGYGRFTGPRDDSPAWQRRAFGWIRVMGMDVLNSMVIYTFATVAFYLLGAGVLNALGVVPKGSQTILVLSNMYTQTLGGWSLYLFNLGAFAVLYSTVFASTAAHSRVFADFVGMLGFYDRRDYGQRLKMIRVFVVILLFVPSVYFMFLREPVFMVKIGGVAQAIMLPIIGFYTVYLRYRHMPKLILPKGWITLALWVSSAVMAVVMGYSVVQRLGG